MTPGGRATNGAMDPSGSARDRGTTGSTPHFIVPDLQPAEALFDELYQRLRVLARSHLRRNEPIMLLDTTGLVHESYMRSGHAAPRPVWR